MKRLFIRTLQQVLVVDAETEEEAHGYITEWSYQGSPKVQYRNIADRIDTAKLEILDARFDGDSYRFNAATAPEQEVGEK